MKGDAPVSLSQLSKVFPNKRKYSASRAGLIKPPAIVEKGNPDWPCQSPGCPGHIKTARKRDGGEFGSCDHRILNDKSSCQVTTTILQASNDHPKFCQLCDRAVGGTPTLGEPTDEKDDRGYTEWNDVCACFPPCTGARTSDGSKFKHATAAAAGHDIIGKPCVMSDSSTNGKDITQTCTGKIKAGDLAVKSWDNPPPSTCTAPSVCGDQPSTASSAPRKPTRSSAPPETEAAKPSATVPDSFKDF